MRTVPDWPRVMRKVRQKDETGTEIVHLGDMVLIRRGGLGGTNTAGKGFDTSPGGRGERRRVI